MRLKKKDVQLVLYKSRVVENIKVYLAGGMDSNWQSNVISDLKDNFIFFNPVDHQLDKSIEYTNWDLFFVNKCDILFAYMEKNNPSGFGLTLEVGYAKALGKIIILIDEKSKENIQFRNKFQIVRSSASVVFDELSRGIEYLKSFNRYKNSNDTILIPM